MPSVIDKIYRAFEQFDSKMSFHIGDVSYSYGELRHRVATIQQQLVKQHYKTNELFAVVCDGSLDTYATILALWFSRLAYLPISPNQPEQRIRQVLREARIKNVILPCDYSGFLAENNEVHCISIPPESTKMTSIRFPEAQSPEDIMYVLFTSGSTGVPKGVPISRNNLDAFVNGFFGLGYSLDENDRFLQMFEFTFDVSVQCFVLPLCIGASVHTLTGKGVKFLEVLKVLRDNNITIAKMVPSTVQFLKPYFNDINLPALRYSLFSGEGLSAGLIKQWADVVPHAIIQNFYGPTEATIDCTYYQYPGAQDCKSENDIMSIGRPFGDTFIKIINEKGHEVVAGEKGELCVSGNQVTRGYVNNKLKNEISFFSDDAGNRYYKTGDIVYLDGQGDLQFCGRRDDQVQIQGHRVELTEISHRSTVITDAESTALSTVNTSGLCEIHLVIASEKVNLNTLLNELKRHLPGYMIPVKIHKVKSFPYNSNGKLDKNLLKSKIGIK